jgi:ABC-type nitrate/sulfonate/bicarbonate transport system ATPase subunit
MKMLLRAEAIEVANQQRKILSGISFSIQTGECVVVLGPSGVGKTTLLKVLAGIIVPSEGSVSLGSGEVPLLRSCAWMAQEDLLLPWRSVLKNVLLPHTASVLSWEMLTAQALSLLNKVGLSGEEHRLPRQLSQGMKQRVALVRTLMMNRPFLLLDEPCSALDAESRKRVLGVLREWVEQHNCGLVMVSHQERDVEILQARSLRLEGGKLCDS